MVRPALHGLVKFTAAVLVPELHGVACVRAVDAVSGDADSALRRLAGTLRAGAEEAVCLDLRVAAHLHSILQRPDRLATISRFELVIDRAAAESRNIVRLSALCRGVQRRGAGGDRDGRAPRELTRGKQADADDEACSRGCSPPRDCESARLRNAQKAAFCLRQSGTTRCWDRMRSRSLSGTVARHRPPLTACRNSCRQILLARHNGVLVKNGEIDEDVQRYGRELIALHGVRKLECARRRGLTPDEAGSEGGDGCGESGQLSG